MTDTQVEAALLLAGIDGTGIDGIRFSFHNEDGFASDTVVTPNIVFEARSTLRTGGDVTPGPDTRRRTPTPPA
ncbi:hypothetical protein [Aeromicrobium sp. UC242_57]|uniref:hypothetical protein n=1 Tax=Aeromicrobium sp. UC242_57 TaxID=3374624 RepID=UPI0037BBCBE8